ncbi:MAG TPA: hypothetical protein VE129_18225 [Thermoanaerobaculia bacterium]|nr:hypothetical protein [Thermoanaerobaculia bacterium]
MALAATFASVPALAELRWTSVRVDADLLADGTVEITEKHVVVASGESFAATRWLDTRRPAVPELVEVVRIGRDDGETKLEAGTLWERDRYEWNGATVTWALRPGSSAPWEAPTTLAYRLRWKVRGALTPVWGPRPEMRPMPGSPLGERLAARWRETREALSRAGPAPFRRWVLDLNVAAPSRQGPIEALDYGLVGDGAWSFAGNFMTVTLDRALPPDEGIDLSFLFDRKAGDRPPGVDLVGPAALVGLALVPAAAGVFLLARTLLAWRRRPPKPGPSFPLPERPEALSPEVFASLFGDSGPLAPVADEVWERLRNEKAVVVDKQEPPNLVLRADPSELRPPEAALVRLLFGERNALSLAQAREAAASLGDRLHEAVDQAFDDEVLLRVGEARRLDAARRKGAGDRADLVPTALLLFLVPLGLGAASIPEKAAGVCAALALAAGLFFAARKGRDAGFGALSALGPAIGSLLLAALLVAWTYLDGGPPDHLRALFLSGTALLVVRAGFVGARPGEAREESPLRLWALEQREALRERLLRGGGEVEPGEAPWFRAAGLEVSLTEPGVPDGDMETVLGSSSGEEEDGEPDR